VVTECFVVVRRVPAPDAASPDRDCWFFTREDFGINETAPIVLGVADPDSAENLDAYAPVVGLDQVGAGMFEAPHSMEATRLRQCSGMTPERWTGSSRRAELA